MSEPLRERVAEAVRLRVQPALAMDGITVEVLGVAGGTVRLRLAGDSPGCPATVRGLLTVLEEELRRLDGVECVEVCP